VVVNINNNMSNYKTLSKDELEVLGRKYGVELDRRILKSKMIKQLEEHIDTLSKEVQEDLAKEKLVNQAAGISDTVIEPSNVLTLAEKKARLNGKSFREVYGFPSKS
jgi:hypothetical protein|tara:strand:- start:970 stop:1290 length:321 start_codon:yes stop_codon:yes gene_type:complete